MMMMMIMKSKVDGKRTQLVPPPPPPFLIFLYIYKIINLFCFIFGIACIFGIVHDFVQLLDYL